MITHMSKITPTTSAQPTTTTSENLRTSSSDSTNTAINEIISEIRNSEQKRRSRQQQKQKETTSSDKNENENNNASILGIWKHDNKEHPNVSSNFLTKNAVTTNESAVKASTKTNNNNILPAPSLRSKADDDIETTPKDKKRKSLHCRGSLLPFILLSNIFFLLATVFYLCLSIDNFHWAVAIQKEERFLIEKRKLVVEHHLREVQRSISDFTEWDSNSRNRYNHHNQQQQHFVTTIPLIYGSTTTPAKTSTTHVEQGDIILQANTISHDQIKDNAVYDDNNVTYSRDLLSSNNEEAEQNKNISNFLGTTTIFSPSQNDNDEISALEFSEMVNNIINDKESHNSERDIFQHTRTNNSSENHTSPPLVVDHPSDWHEYEWSELPENIRKAATKLGFSKEMWDNQITSVLRQVINWDSLSEDEQEAAAVLGHTEATWDNHGTSNAENAASKFNFEDYYYSTLAQRESNFAIPEADIMALLFLAPFCIICASVADWLIEQYYQQFSYCTVLMIVAGVMGLIRAIVFHASVDDGYSRNLLFVSNVFNFLSFVFFVLFGLFSIIIRNRTIYSMMKKKQKGNDFMEDEERQTIVLPVSLYVILIMTDGIFILGSIMNAILSYLYLSLDDDDNFDYVEGYYTKNISFSQGAIAASALWLLCSLIYLFATILVGGQKNSTRYFVL